MSSLILPASARPTISDIEKARMLAEIDCDEIDAAPIQGNRVLVMQWIRDKVGSLIASSQTQKEDEWQGKVGLVLKVGPAAFVDDPEVGAKFYGFKCEPGQWVLFSNSDGENFGYLPKGKHTPIIMKILREGEISMVIPRPDFAW